MLKSLSHSHRLGIEIVVLAPLKTAPSVLLQSNKQQGQEGSRSGEVNALVLGLIFKMNWVSGSAEVAGKGSHASNQMTRSL